MELSLFFKVLLFVIFMFMLVFEIIHFGTKRSERTKKILWGGSIFSVISAYAIIKWVLSDYGRWVLSGYGIYILFACAFLVMMAMAIFGAFHFIKDFRGINKKTLVSVSCLVLIITWGITRWLSYSVLPILDYTGPWNHNLGNQTESERLKLQ